MPAQDDHHPAPKRRDNSGSDLPGEESALDVALREVLAEAAAANGGARAAEAGATPEAAVPEHDTTPSELDLTGTPTRPPTTTGTPTATPTTTSAGDPASDSDRREPMVVEALLLQIPGVDSLAVFKLGSAGLLRLAPLLKLGAADLTRTTGLPPAVAEAVVAVLARWQGGLTAPSREIQAAAWQVLEPLTAQLETVHTSHERATAGWTREQVTARRQLRQDRDRVYMSIKAALASVGELDLMLRLEKLSFARRIDELHRLLRAGAAAGVLTSGRKGPMGDTPNGRTHP